MSSPNAHAFFVLEKPEYFTCTPLLPGSEARGTQEETAGETGGVNTGAGGTPLATGKKLSLGDGKIKAEDSSGVGGKPFIGTCSFGATAPGLTR